MSSESDRVQKHARERLVPPRRKQDRTRVTQKRRHTRFVDPTEKFHVVVPSPRLGPQGRLELTRSRDEQGELHRGVLEDGEELVGSLVGLELPHEEDETLR